jgi:hypothetical protein
MSGLPYFCDEVWHTVNQETGDLDFKCSKCPTVVLKSWIGFIEKSLPKWEPESEGFLHF